MPVYRPLVLAIALASVLAGCSKPPETKVAAAPQETVNKPDVDTKTIDQCLNSERSDLAVSDWLSDKFNHRDSLPPEVENAYLADRFLAEINSGGFLGFFDWQFESVQKTVSALEALNLSDSARALRGAMHLVNPEGWPKTEDEYKAAAEKLGADPERSKLMDQLDGVTIAQSAEIESSTLVYIRKHLAVFQALDR